VVRLPDTHCHLAHERLRHRLAEVLARAEAAGVAPLVNVGIDLESSRLALAQAEDHPGCHPVAGLHPHRARELGRREGLAEELAQLAADPRCVAVGETGLDFHYNHSPPADQEKAFAWHAGLALELGRPLVVHSREAFAPTREMLARFPGLEGVVHCFTGGPREAEAYLELGFHLSFSGLVTRPGMTGPAEAARRCPPERLLLETDAPFLAPHPRQGRRCEPAFLVHTLAHVARLREVAVSRLAARVAANGARLFRLPPAPEAGAGA
jgi:TatD DNase family protein